METTDLKKLQQFSETLQKEISFLDTQLLNKKEDYKRLQKFMKSIQEVQNND